MRPGATSPGAFCFSSGAPRVPPVFAWIEATSCGVYYAAESPWRQRPRAPHLGVITFPMPTPTPFSPLAGNPSPRPLLLAAVLAVLAATAPAAPTHLFVPGHGLTDRTSGMNRTARQLLDECEATGPWMRLIEIAYDWGDLEGEPAPDGTRTWKTAGLARIRQDAEACAARGKYLRVMIQHRYANFPAYMRQGDRHSFSIRDNTPNPGEAPPRVLKLDQPESLKLLEGLYAQVIATLQGSADARKGFYGFVIQETALGESPYLTRPIETAWYANLRAFHQWLAGHLKDFDDAAPRGRLFWQMTNFPAREVPTIIAQLPPGAGLCGPDTFPREPVNFAKDTGKPNNGSLYKTYDLMRQRSDRPISLHVYHGNYNTDRAPFLPDAIRGVQPIWADTNLPSANGLDNKDAGDGIANFLGCVSAGRHPDTLAVHNIIWSTASGTLRPYDQSRPGHKPGRDEASPGQPAGPYGWLQVKNWMQHSGQFPSTDPAGGCTATVPTGID